MPVVSAGVAGVRKADSKDTDFYEVIEAEALRQGQGTGTVSTAHLLPQPVDAERYLAEIAVRAVQVLRLAVLKIIAMSLEDGMPYQAELRGHRITAVARASDASEVYLAVTAEGIPDPCVLAVILDAIPGINAEDWLPEPGGVAGITPSPGQVIWSTIIPGYLRISVADSGAAGNSRRSGAAVTARTWPCRLEAVEKVVAAPTG